LRYILEKGLMFDDKREKEKTIIQCSYIES